MAQRRRRGGRGRKGEGTDTVSAESALANDEAESTAMDEGPVATPPAHEPPADESPSHDVKAVALPQSDGETTDAPVPADDHSDAEPANDDLQQARPEREDRPRGEGRRDRDERPRGEGRPERSDRPRGEDRARDDRPREDRPRRDGRDDRSRNERRPEQRRDERPAPQAQSRTRRIAVIHGPNLNLLGTREPKVYGTTTLAQVDQNLRDLATDLGAQVTTFQSAREGALIEHIHGLRGRCDGIVINAAGYSHTSIALRDALIAVGIPFVEVHVSNVYARESFRHKSVLADVARGVIVGFGALSYELALGALLHEG